MIKNFIKKILLLFSLMLLAIYTVQSLIQGLWTNTIFAWQLVILAGLICLAQLLTIQFKSNYYLVEVFVEYLMVCIIVGLEGLTFGWFQFYNLWQILLYVTPVYVIGYFLDLSRTKRDVDYINEKIKQRAEREMKNESSINISKECK